MKKKYISISANTYLPDGYEELEKASKLILEYLNHDDIEWPVSLPTGITLDKQKDVIHDSVLGGKYVVRKFDKTSLLESISNIERQMSSLSYQIKSLTDSFEDTNSRLAYLSDLLRSNANSYKSVIENIKDDSDLQAIKLKLNLPTKDFVSDLKLVLGENGQSKSISKKLHFETSFQESEELLIFNNDESFLVKRASGELLYKGIENEKELVKIIKKLFPNKVSKRINNFLNTPKIEIKESKNERNKSFISAGSLGSSKLIKSNVGWFSVFRAYIENNYVLDARHVIAKFNKATRDKYRLNRKRTGNEVSHVSSIHNQIKRGLERSFPELEPNIDFEKVESEITGIRYKLKVQ